MSFICSNCAQRAKTKEPDSGADWRIGICKYCGEKSYLCSESSWGISTTSGKEVGDQEVEYLKNLFNME